MNGNKAGFWLHTNREIYPRTKMSSARKDTVEGDLYTSCSTSARLLAIIWVVTFFCRRKIFIRGFIYRTLQNAYRFVKGKLLCISPTLQISPQIITSQRDPGLANTWLSFYTFSQCINYHSETEVAIFTNCFSIDGEKESQQSIISTHLCFNSLT